MRVRPAMVTVEFENDQIRVLRLRYAAHEKLPLHSHPARLVVMVSENHGRSTLPSGTAEDTLGHPGQIVWREAGAHQVENLGDAPMENIEVELKKAGAPGVTVPAGGPAGAAGPEPVPVEREPRHHVVFQNQYVRVLDVTLLPGQPSLYHTHSNDNLAVSLSGDRVQIEPQGQAWGEPVEVVSGEVRFRAAKGRPYTHRVQSAGKLPFHVIDVEIFP